MQFLRFVHRTRILMGLGLLGLLAFSVGCDGGSGGVSNVTPATPPSGQSGADQAALRKDSNPIGNAAAKKLGDRK
jgi:hypothetical protein